MGCEPIGSCTRLTGMTGTVSLVIYGCIVPGLIGAATMTGAGHDQLSSSAYATASASVSFVPSTKSTANASAPNAARAAATA